jgi:hypothetical protein
MRDAAVSAASRAARVIPLALFAASCMAACGDDPDPPLPADAAVEVIPAGCPRDGGDGRGDGLVVVPGRVLTVAHVVAGADRVDVRTRSGTTSAVVTMFDPANDVAVLAIDPAFAPAIPIGTAQADERGLVVVYRNGTPTVVRVRIADVVTIRTEDIYLDKIHDRPGYVLEAEIVSGDSGGVVVVDHRAVAVVWARSNRENDRAWAVDAMLVADRLTSSAPVDTGECTD